MLKDIKLSIKMKTIECSELSLKLRTKEKELENLRKLMSVLEKKVMKSRSSIADKSITIRKLTEDNKNLRERNSDLKNIIETPTCSMKRTANQSWR